jgi:hypothetical protein
MTWTALDSGRKVGRLVGRTNRYGGRFSGTMIIGKSKFGSMARPDEH